MTARGVTRRIQMPPAVWRHAVLGRGCNPPWALLAAHADRLADQERWWLDGVLEKLPTPVEPWMWAALAC